MGSGCCKSEDVHPIQIIPGLKRINSDNLPLITERTKDLTELTVQESINQLFKTIPWQRGDLIGEGVYGKVYQAMNLDTGELIAVKSYTLSATAYSADKELLNIKHELSILKSLNHPNVVKYFQVDYNDQTNTVDILMEYVPSGSMNALLAKYARFSEAAIRNYTRQLLEGLSYLHSNEIIHRDLKSANLLITEGGCLKLSDFGCSRRFDSSVSAQSQSFKGSPYWMAPEVVSREGHSFPADIWSLGCLVIEMASGKPPWSNFSNLSREVLKLIAKPKNLPKFPKVSVALRDFIGQCLQREPERRPTAQELMNHEFIIQGTAARCYDSIRSSSIAISVKNSINEAVWAKNKDL